MASTFQPPSSDGYGSCGDAARASRADTREFRDIAVPRRMRPPSSFPANDHIKVSSCPLRCSEQPTLARSTCRSTPSTTPLAIDSRDRSPPSLLRRPLEAPRLGRTSPATSINFPSANEFPETVVKRDLKPKNGFFSLRHVFTASILSCERTRPVDLRRRARRRRRYSRAGNSPAATLAVALFSI